MTVGLEYVAGKLSGQSVGYQSRGTLDSNVGRSGQPFPLVRSASARTAEQRALDYEYNSVDEDEDGIPDKAPVRTTSYNSGVVRLASPAYDNTQTTIRLVDPAPAPASAPVPVRTTNYNSGIVRLTSPAQVSNDNTPTTIRLVDQAPVRTTNYDSGVVRLTSPVSFDSTRQHSSVRVVDPAQYSKSSSVRFISPSKTSSFVSPTIVRVADPAPVETFQPNTVRLVSSAKTSSYPTPTIVRVADPYTQISQVRAVPSTGRLVSSSRGSYYRPAQSIVRVVDSVATNEQTPAIFRVANNRGATYQSSVPSISQQVVETPAFRSPVSTNYDDSKTVVRSQNVVPSTGPLDDFLRKIETNSRSADSYETFDDDDISTAIFVSSVQQPSQQQQQQQQSQQPLQQQQFQQQSQVAQDDSISVDAVGLSRSN